MIYFTGREIRDYTIELNGSEIVISEVEVEYCDALDKILEAGLDEVSEEVSEYLTGNWDDFSQKEQEAMLASLSKHLGVDVGTKAPTDYEVGMVLRATKDKPFYIHNIWKGREIKVLGYDKILGIKLDIEGSWSLPPFDALEKYGFELVGTGEEEPLSKFTTQELLLEINKRIGE